MNKKIFTLLVGALILIGSSFMASAQTPTVHHKEYNVTSFVDTLRADTAKYLVNKDNSYYLLSVTDIANPTGQVKSSLGDLVLEDWSKSVTKPDPRKLSYVLFVDSAGNLSLDTLSNLDVKNYYKFRYQNPKVTGTAFSSDKIGAIRRSSWCVSYTEFPEVNGSNPIFDFTNMDTGLALEAPSPEKRTNWKASAEGKDRIIYDNGGKINLINDDNVLVSGWHFSNTVKKDHLLQTGMPLYSYVSKDTVVVLVLDDKYGYNVPTTKGVGGWSVAAKKVAVNDLVRDNAGNVRLVNSGLQDDASKYVQNVLLFTLKYIDKIVLNANDYNSIFNTITFTPDAKNDKQGNQGWNPFTESGKLDPYGRGYLRATEVNDSLYRYGYMQFHHVDGTGKFITGADSGWLYVDTAFLNYGNEEFLRFNFSKLRRDNSLGAQLPANAARNLIWGTTGFPNGEPKKSDAKYDKLIDGKVYWRLDSLVWAVLLELENQNSGPFAGLVNAVTGEIDNAINITTPAPGSGWTPSLLLNQPDDASADALFAEIITEAKLAGYSGILSSLIPNKLGDDYNSSWATVVNLASILATDAGNTSALTPNVDYIPRPDYDTDAWDIPGLAAYEADVRSYKFAISKDSIMENQSKFRVVYYPFEDSTFINVYQTRVRYKDLKTGEIPTWWTNSFRFAANGVIDIPSSVYADYADYRTSVLLANPLLFNALNRPTLLSPFGPGAHYFHTFADNYENSSPAKMDKVMISTADTAVFYFNNEPLSHLYGFSTKTNGVSNNYYKDSLFYVDIQNLGTAIGLRVATLDQAQKDKQKLLDTKISLGFSICKAFKEEEPKRADVPNDLYLIRNSVGEYLCVPIWSITDSVYWVTPEKWEDPTQIPSYQWAVENINKTGNSAFKLTNREFEKVSFNYVYVDQAGDSEFIIAGAYSHANFTKRGIVRAGKIDITKQQAIRLGHFEDVNLYSTATYSFLPLDKSVKKEQLLGYTYIDPDSTIVDIYAFKYYHFLATGADARYFGWNGFNNPKVDTLVKVTSINYHDKLYFELQQMEYANIGRDRLLIGYKIDGKTPLVEKDLKDYKSIYDKYGKKTNNYTNRDSLVLENFGYMPTVSATSKEYNYSTIADLQPLARQAYRLLLKDYYKYYPTVRGDYMTVGEQDNYILANRIYAARDYVPNSGKVEGIFGIPYFYFRNTNFQIPGIKNGQEALEDYFALIQRVDTITPIYGQKLDEIEEYISMKFDNTSYTEPVSKRIINQIRSTHELGVFAAVVSDDMAKLKIAVRGDVYIAVSTFTLERDADPIYRRFHWNDTFERNYQDKPLKLEFHRMNNEAQKLFENNGSDKSSGGGYGYNLNPDNGQLYKDSVGNIISFLGIKNIYTHPSLTANDNPHGNTNYGIYVDTAFIRRGTGWIKPQYMFVVDPHKVDICDACVDNTKLNFRPYTIGRYMFNTAMYAKKILPSADDVKNFKGTGVNYDYVQPIDDQVYHAAINGVTGKAYTEVSSISNKWERLAFTWAIHRGDSLWILKGVAPEYLGRQYDAKALAEQLGKEYGGDLTKNNIDFEGQLLKMKGKSMAEVIAAKKTIGLHAIINLADNSHKDWVWSLRFIERHADDFVIESETTNRDRVNGEIIRPGHAGWIKYENNVPTISRGDLKDLMAEGEAFNVVFSDVEPVDNDNVKDASDVKVIGGIGSVTIQNAAGKNIIISNILGQTLANTKLNSDNASIQLPAGVVLVVIEGESFKAIVK